MLTPVATRVPLPELLPTATVVVALPVRPPATVCVPLITLIVLVPVEASMPPCSVPPVEPPAGLPSVNMPPLSVTPLSARTLPEVCPVRVKAALPLTVVVPVMPPTVAAPVERPPMPLMTAVGVASRASPTFCSEAPEVSTVMPWTVPVLPAAKSLSDRVLNSASVMLEPA